MGSSTATEPFPPGTLFLIFDCPSERFLPSLYSDLNEKARRSRIAGQHLAQILLVFPQRQRVCLVGHGDGGRVILTALHLLSGAELPGFLRELAARIAGARRDLRIRAITIEAAVGHHWLNPGECMDQALGMCESLLNLHNRRDYALSVYVLGQYTGLRPALGRIGLTNHDPRKLGPLSARVKQYELNRLAGFSHATFSAAMTDPEIAQSVRDVFWWNPIEPSPLP